MMNLFSLLQRSNRDLQARRKQHAIHTTLLCVLIGITVFCVLNICAPNLDTCTVVITSRTVQRGDRITSSDLALVTVPSSDVITQSAVHSTDQVEGTIAQTTLAKGTMITHSTLRQSPQIPKQYSPVDVRIFGNMQQFLPGDAVTLHSNATCDDGQDSCVICERAIILDPEQEEEQTITMAMPAKDAIRVLQSQEVGPVLASAYE